ncbi:MAG: thioredoxin domain-containing protein [Terracidiphilus sp.]|jgi:protein-disulfide isomerase
MSKLSIAVSIKDHMQGDPAAECSLVEYGDYECPHCGTAYPIVKRLQEHFAKRLSFVFRNFPLSQIHPWAEPAAEVAEFAGAHSKFWEMHDMLFENQESLSNALFLDLADRLDLSPSQLQTAVTEQTYRARVRADFSGGARSGVNGTPTFFINGQRHNGAFDFDALSNAIEQTLRVGKPARRD